MELRGGKKGATLGKNSGRVVAETDPSEINSNMAKEAGLNTPLRPC